MTEMPVVRCPGPKGEGCPNTLPLNAEFCIACGEVFDDHELYLIYAESVGSA